MKVILQFTGGVGVLHPELLAVFLGHADGEHTTGGNGDGLPCARVPPRARRPLLGDNLADALQGYGTEVFVQFGRHDAAERVEILFGPGVGQAFRLLKLLDQFRLGHVFLQFAHDVSMRMMVAVACGVHDGALRGDILLAG